MANTMETFDKKLFKRRKNKNGAQNNAWARVNHWDWQTKKHVSRDSKLQPFYQNISAVQSESAIKSKSKKKSQFLTLPQSFNRKNRSEYTIVIVFVIVKITWIEHLTQKKKPATNSFWNIEPTLRNRFFWERKALCHTTD